ncbi:MAG TPA: 4-hydroxyphenylpyruvate dioxygenase [Candidatus Elarobacter sp.]
MTAAASVAAPRIDNTGFRFDHLELWVGNAKQSAFYYCAALGFEALAYRGPETGAPDVASYVLRQNGVRLVITSGLRPDDEIGRHVAAHGDGVRGVAIAVDDVAAVYAYATAHGAHPIETPRTVSDGDGEAVVATIGTYGDTVHTLVQRSGYHGAWLPGYVAIPASTFPSRPVGLTRIDHCVANVGWGEMDRWCDYYAHILGLTPLISFDDKDISTDYTALKSRVMQSDGGGIKFPINEPAHGKKKSQIEEYLEFYGGPGIQHIAIQTDDIVGTVSALRANGVELLDAPESYYDELTARVGAIEEDIEALRKLSILVDRDDQGYMLQIFTKPLQDRPTVFIEIIQRHGAQSFGKGNFKALFVSIEQEQAKRGTL